MAYVDTSVLVAYYCPEALSRKAQREIGKSGVPTVSPLTEVEFCSALGIKVRTGGLDVLSAHRVLSCFQSHCADGVYRIVPIENPAYALARRWITSFSAPLRTLDALHLAVAFMARQVLLTADRAMATSAKEFGVRHRLLTS